MQCVKPVELQLVMAAKTEQKIGKYLDIDSGKLIVAAKDFSLLG